MGLARVRMERERSLKARDIVVVVDVRVCALLGAGCCEGRGIDGVL